MTKIDFLNILRQALSDEMDARRVDEHVKFYDDYISSKGKENEEAILEELGDPRLIARSIIDANQKDHMYSNKSQGSEYEQYEDDISQDIHYKVFSNFKWYHKLIGILIIAIIVLFFIFVSKIVLAFIFSLGFPLLIIFLLIALIRNKR